MPMKGLSGGVCPSVRSSSRDIVAQLVGDVSKVLRRRDDPRGSSDMLKIPSRPPSF